MPLAKLRDNHHLLNALERRLLAEWVGLDVGDGAALAERVAGVEDAPDIIVDGDLTPFVAVPISVYVVWDAWRLVPFEQRSAMIAGVLRKVILVDEFSWGAEAEGEDQEGNPVVTDFVSQLLEVDEGRWVDTCGMHGLDDQGNEIGGLDAFYDVMSRVATVVGLTRSEASGMGLVYEVV